MSILQIGMGWFGDQPGGLNRYFHGLIGELDRQGVPVKGLVAGLDSVSERSKGLMKSFGLADSLLPFRLMSARKAVKSFLLAEKPSLVVAHFAPYVFPSLGLLRGVPLVVHFHGPWAAESAVEKRGAMSQLVKFHVERKVYERATLIIVLSEAFKAVLQSRYAVPLDKIRVIPGGINVAEYLPSLSKEEARMRLGWPIHARIVFTVRRLAKRMGLENLIAASGLIKSTHPDVQIFIGGAGHARSDLERLIETHGVGDRVRLCGFVPENLLSTAFHAADLSIVPTLALEGFGLTTIESLASGTPVLVTPIGGLPEVVSELSDQLVLKGALAESIADGIKSYFEDGPKLSAEDCVDYVRDRYSWEAICRRVTAVYEEANVCFLE